METTYVHSLLEFKPLKKNAFKFFLCAIPFLFLFQSCVTVRPGEIGLVMHYGKMQTKTFSSGRHVSGIFGTHVIKMDLHVVEYSAKMDLPTKEGVEVSADMTLLYHLKPEAAQKIYETFGLNYGRILVINNFIADSREATLNYYAKDIINERDNLEKMMRDSLQSAVGPYGIVVDELLVKDIDLPSEVDAVIQDQVRAQQDVKSTELGIEKQRKEQVFTLEKDSMQEAANIQKQRMDEKFAIEKDSMQTAADIQEQRTQEQFAIEKQKDEAKRTLIEANAK